jgi:hypothetical protein
MAFNAQVLWGVVHHARQQLSILYQLLFYKKIGMERLLPHGMTVLEIPV